MIGSFLTSGLVMIFGYAYPAYECYKTVEKNKPEVEQLRFWCQYWILVAVLAVCERIADIFIFWLPMYSEAKLALYIYLWYPKAKGAAYVYDSFVRPYIAKHETEIDRNLMEFRTRAGDMIVMYSQKAATYGQKRVFEILQFVASQPFPRPYQNQAGQKPEPKAAHRPTVTSNRQVTATAQQQVEEAPSPISSTSSSQQEEELEQEVISSPAPKVAVTTKSIQLKLKKTVQHSNKTETSTLKKTTPESSESTDDSANEADLDQTVQDKTSSPPQETVMEDTIRETRGRLRKTRAVVKKDA